MSIFKVITDEEAVKNFNHYTAELAKAKTHKSLIQLGQIVINLQKQPNGNFIFPQGKSKEFWDSYKAKKEEYVKQMQNLDNVGIDQKVS